MYKLNLEISNCDKNILRSIAIEDRETFQNNRASIVYTFKNNVCIINIVAKDIIALRASVNTIFRLINMLETIKKEILNTN